MTFMEWWHALKAEVTLLLKDTNEGRLAPNDRRGARPAKRYARGEIGLWEYWRQTKEMLERKWDR